MNRAVYVIIPILAVLTVIASCSSDKSEVKMPEEFDKFTSVYAELSVAFELAARDSLRYVGMRDSILGSFDADTVWLQEFTGKFKSDPELWLKVWEEISKKLEARKDSLTP